MRIGGMLLQVWDGKDHALAYYSRTLSKTKRNYCVTWWELLAIGKMLEHFHRYLCGQEFHSLFDHSTLI
jgi:hypothetical protein